MIDKDPGVVDLTDEERREIIDQASFSFIVPTYQEFGGLKRTLGNIIFQSSQNTKREIIVVGDGFEQEAEDIVKKAQQSAVDLQQHVVIHYMSLNRHSGGGNIPRMFGLKKASYDWVVFADAGTGITYTLCDVLGTTAATYPKVKIITWDMVQQLDPVPFVSNARVLDHVDRSHGLPYVIPGCAIAIKRECAQLVEWPDKPASDWVYTSTLWEQMFFEDGAENTDKVNDEVAIIPWVLTIAYSARDARKWREPSNKEIWEANHWGMGYTQAKATFGGDLISVERQDSDAVQG